MPREARKRDGRQAAERSQGRLQGRRGEELMSASHAATANTAANCSLHHPPWSSRCVVRYYRALPKEGLAWASARMIPPQHPIRPHVPVQGAGLLGSCPRRREGRGGSEGSLPLLLGHTHTHRSQARRLSRLLKTAVRMPPRTSPGRVLPPGTGPSTAWTSSTSTTTCRGLDCRWPAVDGNGGFSGFLHNIPFFRGNSAGRGIHTHTFAISELRVDGWGGTNNHGIFHLPLSPPP